jgi:hypothetical protein
MPCGHCGRDARGTLAPVTDGEVESVVALIPVVRDPDGAGVGGELVAAGDPDPATAVDDPVAGDPDVAGAGDAWAAFDDDGGRRGLDNGDLFLHGWGLGDDDDLAWRRGRRRGLVDDGWWRWRRGLIHDGGRGRCGLNDDDITIMVVIVVVFDVDAAAALAARDGEGKRRQGEGAEGELHLHSCFLL